MRDWGSDIQRKVRDNRVRVDISIVLDKDFHAFSFRAVSWTMVNEKFFLTIMGVFADFRDITDFIFEPDFCKYDIIYISWDKKIINGIRFDISPTEFRESCQW